MKKQMYALLDHTAQVFLNPISFVNDADAIRWFGTVVNNTEGIKKLFTSDTKSVELDWTGVMTDYATMQVTDIAIGLRTSLERGLIDQLLPSNPLTDHGNLTTWVNRANRWSEGITTITAEKPNP